MKVIHLNRNSLINDSLVVTIGQFDGIHKAHQMLIKKTVSCAKEHNKKSAVVTFNPHIDTILKNTSPNDYIIDLDSKIKLLESMEVDYLLIINFTKSLANIKHDDFFLEYFNNLDIFHFIVGFDFTYGFKGLGNVNTICKDYAKKTNLTIISKQEYSNEKIGSLEIKKALREGNITKANNLLGYNFFLNATVINKSDQKTFITSTNQTLLKQKTYNVLINNKRYVLTINNEMYIENIDLDNSIKQLKIEFDN